MVDGVEEKGRTRQLGRQVCVDEGIEGVVPPLLGAGCLAPEWGTAPSLCVCFGRLRPRWRRFGWLLAAGSSLGWRSAATTIGMKRRHGGASVGPWCNEDHVPTAAGLAGPVLLRVSPEKASLRTVVRCAPSFQPVCTNRWREPSHIAFSQYARTAGVNRLTASVKTEM